MSHAEDVESGSVESRDDVSDTTNTKLKQSPEQLLDTDNDDVEKEDKHSNDIISGTVDAEAALGSPGVENEETISGETDNDRAPVESSDRTNLPDKSHIEGSQAGPRLSSTVDSVNQNTKTESFPTILGQTSDDVVGQNAQLVTKIGVSREPSQLPVRSKCESSHAYSLPLLVPRTAEIGFQPPRDDPSAPRYNFIAQRTTIRPKMIRAATISLTSSTPSLSSRERSLNADDKSRSKLVTWEEATQSRPPLRIDMEGPTPCTYSPRNKPLGETNAPAYSFGSKCQPVKNGGGRTSWWKPWFQTPHVWLNKVDFSRDQSWPTPSLYSNRVSLGANHSSTPSAPAFTIQERKTTLVKLPGVVDSPSPNCYSRQSADRQTLKRSSSFTHGQRRGGTVLWSYREVTPGPAYYEASPSALQTNPAFTIQGARRDKSFALGPFSTF